MAKKQKIKPKALGRGLAALIPDKGAKGLPQGTSTAGKTTRHMAPLEEIVPMPGQPRTDFPPEALDELAESIRENGILQPILVRKTSNGYQLIAGERRWRAARQAGLETIPIIIKDVGESEAYQMSLIENIQREDLNPVDIARGFKKLIDAFDLTQVEAARRVGKNRASVANYLRILKLPRILREKIEDRTLSFGHARSMAGLAPEQLSRLNLERICRGDISVRELEQMVAKVKMDPNGSGSLKKTKQRESTQLRHLRRNIERRVGLKVSLKDKNGKGEVRFVYNSYDELQNLLDMLQIPQS